MWQIQKTTNLLTRLIILLVFVAQFIDTVVALSDKRLCADENCKDIISMGTGTINYRAGAEGMVSFKINTPIRIKSKSAGKDPSLWGVEVNGREGYAPKQFIRENKIIIRDQNLKFEVDVENPGNELPVLNSSENMVGQIDALDGPTTTTKPLDMIPVESNEEPIVKNTVENVSSEKPAVATPVLMNLVDGTQIPLMDDNTNGLNEGEKMNEIVTQSDDDDGDEIGDYDDDDEKTFDMDNLSISESNMNNISNIESLPENLVLHNQESLNNEEKHDSRSSQEQYSTEKPSEENETQAYVETVETKNMQTNKELPFYPEPTQRESNHAELVTEPVTLPQNSPENLEQTTELALNISLSPQTTTDKSSNPELSSSIENSQIKTNETKDSTHGINKAKIIDKTSKSNENPPRLDEIKKDVFDTNSESTESSTRSKMQIEETPPIQILDAISIEYEDFNDAPQITENETETKKNDENLLLKDLSHKPQEELIDLQSEKQLTENQMDSTLTINNQPINDNMKVPLDPDLTTLLENPHKVPTETTHILEEYAVSDNTKETSITVSDQESNMNNISNIESLPENLVLHNQESLNNEEKHDSRSSQEQYSTEKPSEENETQAYVETVETKNMQTNKELPFYPEPTQRESNHAELVTEPVTLPQNSPENLEQTTELALNISLSPQTTTDKSSNPETKITETTTASPSSIFESEPYQHTTTNTPSSFPYAELNNDLSQHQADNVNQTPYNPYDDAPSNTPLPPQYDNGNPDSLSSSSSSSPLSTTTEILQYDYFDQQATAYDPLDYIEHEVVTENPMDSHHDQSSVGYGSIEPSEVVSTPEPHKSVEKAPIALPSLTTPSNEDYDTKENKGLFATIMGTVNNMLSSNKKANHEEHNEKVDLHKILYPSGDPGHKIKNRNEGNNIQYCEKLGPNGDCPHSEPEVKQPTDDCDCSFTKSLLNADLTFDTFVQSLASKILEISELIAFLAIVAATSIFFIFGYYCFCNSSREGALLSKLNQLESSLLATHKENAILKHNLMSTRQKLASIEDNSFGSNDMVVSLKTELEEELVEKARLQEQITNLQKELENAADAGIELNKIVSELLSNQTGDESIISSVEELQKQLNEQQNTILEINGSLAEKSRENSELQLLIAEQNARYESEIANLQRDNDDLEQEKGNLQARLEEIRSDFDKDITVALEGKNFEIKRLQNEIVELSNKLETEHTKWQTSMAKVEALGECLKNVKRDPNVNITQVIDVANIRADLIDAQKKYTTIKERLEMQLDSRKLAESQLQIVSAEVEKLKQDFNQSEKDKLEAQTRLEVLSNYFKDKENQLQKELSLKEAMWLKQQGETTSTVDRLTAMKEEIQSLKSQNDSLRAEVEAQVAAHKAQTGTLENRAHETWLAARQSDRRYEEARAEATALRRKLTALAGGSVNEANKPSAGSAGLGDELTNAPSPIHMEPPGSPMLGRMPPPPFLPPPFMGPPPPFMGMPPLPPFVPPGEMRPAPLGRIMSPPPQRSSRFSPPHLDYEDYLDYESTNAWHRHTYSPPPRTYRSLSPTDSRYNYGTEHDLMSKYDTETDFSPPPSPRESRRRGGGGGNGSERGNNNNTRSLYNNSKKSNSAKKAPLSSGSEKSYNSSSHHGDKSNSGNTGVGKSLV